MQRGLREMQRAWERDAERPEREMQKGLGKRCRRAIFYLFTLLPFYLFTF